jgi:phage FluMu protein Com
MPVFGPDKLEAPGPLFADRHHIAGANIHASHSNRGPMNTSPPYIEVKCPKCSWVHASVPLDTALLHTDSPEQKGLRQVHKVTRAERNQLVVKHPSMMSLDPGELHLYAHLLAIGGPQTNLVVASTADKGAIVRAGDLQWLDQLIALEDLLSEVGASRPKMAALKRHYSATWLSDVRMKVRMGVIP